MGAAAAAAHARLHLLRGHHSQQGSLRLLLVTRRQSCHNGLHQHLLSRHALVCGGRALERAYRALLLNAQRRAG